MRTININLGVTKNQWVNLNPYTDIGEVPVTFRPLDLFKGEVVKDLWGTYWVVNDIGSGGFFGKDSYSWIWIEFKKKMKNCYNPNRYYISINTHNPEEVYHRTPERPEGSKYGGVIFGGWCSSVAECIEKYFPNRHLKKSTGPMYWNRTLNIVSIIKTDLVTGKVREIKVTKKHTTLLQNLKK